MLLLGFWAREEQESKALMQRPRYSKALPRGPVRAALSLQFLYQRNGKEAHGRELTKCLLLHTNLTCEQLAMVLVGKPMDGAQATSRTQSLWASSFCSSFHWPSSSLKTQLHSQKGSSSILHHLMPCSGKLLIVPFRLLVHQHNTNHKCSSLLQKPLWLELTKSPPGDRKHRQRGSDLQLLSEICNYQSGNQRPLETHP